MLVHMNVRDAAATRQRILEHAQRQFARHGYAGVAVKGVADAAGVSPNLVTRYFGGKDGLSCRRPGWRSRSRIPSTG